MRRTYQRTAKTCGEFPNAILCCHRSSCQHGAPDAVTCLGRRGSEPRPRPVAAGSADFSMLLAHRLNFLLDQARLALDPRTEHRHREWAEREIDELLHIMPTPRQLADVLAVTRDCVQAIPH